MNIRIGFVIMVPQILLFHIIAFVNQVLINVLGPSPAIFSQFFRVEPVL